MTERVVVIGAGGFGRETLDVIEAAIAAGADLQVLGVVDGGPRQEDVQRLRDRGVAYLGTDIAWLSEPHPGVRFVVAIGNPIVRERVASSFTDAGLRALSVIHPRAVIGSQVEIGDGVVICSGVQISTNVKAGHHVHLNPGCVIGHDSKLDDCVSVNPAAIVSGNVHVQQRSLIGAGAVVLQGLTLEPDVTVGAAACVTRDVTAGNTVVGIPARKKGRD